MALTNVREDIYAAIVDGETAYVMELLCTAAGDLPDVYLFVQKIINIMDSSTDTFTRLATMADLEDLETNRASAVANGATYWRNSYMKVTFTALDTAVAAKVAIQDRIHQLALDYVTYDTDFRDASTHTFPYPTGYNTHVDELTDDFYTAYDTYLSAADDLVAKQDVLTAAQAQIAPGSAASARKTFAEQMFTQLSSLYAETVSLQSRFGSFTGASDGTSNCEWFIDQAEAFLILHPDVGFEAQKNTFLARVAAERVAGGAEFVTTVTDHLTALALATGEKTNATAAYDALVNSSTVAQADLDAATAAKSNAWALLTAAYNDLNVACPNFEASHGYTFPPTPV